MPSVPRIDITLDADMEAAGGFVSSADGRATPLRLPFSLRDGLGSGGVALLFAATDVSR